MHSAKRPDPASQLGNRIVAFALGAEGRQVGDGECFALADQALASADAKSAAFYTEITWDGDYIWGTPVRPESAKPGDILQFRNFRIVRRMTLRTRDANGAVNTMQNEEEEARDHHTAIVLQNLGNALAILEQNVDPLGRVVQRNTIEIASGTTNATDTARATQTTKEVVISGDIRAYRPQRNTPAALADNALPGM